MTDNVLPAITSKRILFAILSLLAALVLLQRMRGMNDVIERDTAGYAVIGHEMLAGRALYSDLWERKPPLLYATFAGAELIAGYGQREIFLVNVSAALVTLLAVFFAANACGGNVAGLFAAAIWLLIGNDIRCQADQPNAEVFVNACLTSAVAVMLNMPSSRLFFNSPDRKAGDRPANHAIGRPIPGLLAWAVKGIQSVTKGECLSLASTALGVLSVMASLYEQHIVITCGLLLIAHLRHRNRNAAIAESLLAGSIMLATWIAITTYFAATGRFHAFFDTLFRQNVAYGGSLPINVLRGFAPSKLLPACMPWVIVILGMIAINYRFGSRPLRLSRPVALLLAWAIGTAITVALPGKSYVHYYQLWLPIWCIAGGWAAGGLLQHNPPRRAIRIGTVATAMAALAAMNLPQYWLNADDRLRAKYPRERFAQHQQLGSQLKSLLSPDERFYNLGEDTTIYFYAQRSPGSGLIYVSPLTTGNNTAEYVNRLINDLRTNDLLLISLDHEHLIHDNPPLAKFLRDHYQAVPGNFGCHYHRVMVRNGSNLTDRLSAPQYAQIPMD